MSNNKEVPYVRPFADHIPAPRDSLHHAACKARLLAYRPGAALVAMACEVDICSAVAWHVCPCAVGSLCPTSASFRLLNTCGHYKAVPARRLTRLHYDVQIRGRFPRVWLALKALALAADIRGFALCVTVISYFCLGKQWHSTPEDNAESVPV